MYAELKNAVIGIEFGSSRDACILDARFRSMRSIVSQSRGSVQHCVTVTVTVTVTVAACVALSVRVEGQFSIVSLLLSLSLLQHA